MKLKALDQIHISAVKPAEPLKKNEEFEVGDALGGELIKKHPHYFEVIEGPNAPGAKAKAPDTAPASGDTAPKPVPKAKAAKAKAKAKKS
ncbi:hypothetical protein IZ6_07710 [Terrihabitans soli]|uniref:Uncharacterized protein n=1 Tax=Terrihabitans soli TaxID=708113 RepID=A0A6S6QL63_9HYPH|nr:hypothetical protein [Terrihabitans soli]BCJ90036.1 hypothetical protein IZ6_07710 [Terrihabitans soli]